VRWSLSCHYGANVAAACSTPTPSGHQLSLTTPHDSGCPDARARACVHACARACARAWCTRACAGALYVCAGVTVHAYVRALAPACVRACVSVPVRASACVVCVLCTVETTEGASASAGQCVRASARALASSTLPARRVLSARVRALVQVRRCSSALRGRVLVCVRVKACAKERYRPVRACAHAHVSTGPRWQLALPAGATGPPRPLRLGLGAQLLQPPHWPQCRATAGPGRAP
jgi:hypothetical protein